MRLDHVNGIHAYSVPIHICMYTNSQCSTRSWSSIHGATVLISRGRSHFRPPGRFPITPTVTVAHSNRPACPFFLFTRKFNVE